MNKSVRWIAAGSAALALAGCATQPQQPAANTATSTTKAAVASKPAAPKPAAKPAPPKVAEKAEAPKPAPKPVAKPAPPPTPRLNEFDQAIEALKLQGPDLAKFKAAMDAREKAMADFANTAEGKKLAALRTALAAAKEAKDDAKVKELQAQIDPLGKKEGDLRVAQRAAVFGSLTLAQQRQWAGYALCNWAIGRGVRKVKLTDDQRQQVRTICDKIAADFVKADTMAKDPYLISLKDVQPEVVKQVTDKVLTAEQKAAMQPAAVAAPKK